MRSAKEFPTNPLSRKVRSSLALRGLTQRDLAARLGISEATVSRILRGMRRARAAEREQIENTLGYSVARLFRRRRCKH